MNIHIFAQARECVRCGVRAFSHLVFPQLHSTEPIGEPILIFSISLNLLAAQVHHFQMDNTSCTIDMHLQFIYYYLLWFPTHWNREINKTRPNRKWLNVNFITILLLFLTLFDFIYYVYSPDIFLFDAFVIKPKFSCQT